MSDENITIVDVAEALGVSKTTVSRAISGKGRIGETTRQKVLDYIQEHDYKPNVIARGLAQSKTFNLCVVMPGDYALVDLPFFQEVIAGIQEIAGVNEYDILLCICSESDITSLERVIRNRKVDGVILLRTFLKDMQIELLQEKKIPFVTTGSTLYKNITQVDHDHRGACRELTSILLMNGLRRIALVGGTETFVVTQSRLLGYHEAFADALIDEAPELLFLNMASAAQMDRAVELSLERDADCILCMDDAICSRVIRKLHQLGASVPQDVRIASYYYSSLLENNVPPVTSLSFNAKELGKEACRFLLTQIAGDMTPKKLLLSYEVMLRESTE